MDIQIEVRDFREGVQGALESDEIPNNALTSGWNTAFRSVGANKGVIGTRPGLDTVNDTPITDVPAIHRIVPYTYDDGTEAIHYAALVCANGKLYYKEDDDAIGSVLTPPANFPYAVSLAFTSGVYPVDGAVMNNSLFLVNTNGERRSLIDDEYEPFGLSPIATVAATNVASGTSSMPAETYNVAVTTYDNDCGEESSLSASISVTTTANQRIEVTITPTAGETAQYPFWRVYLQRVTTQAYHYRVLVLENNGGTNIVTTGDIPIATTTVYIDLAAATIASLILQAPTTTENDPPPSSIYLVEAYGNRLIVADRSYIYWSNLGKPRGFDPENKDQVITGEGDEITGLHQFSDEVCLIFTRTATFGLFGNDPQSWILKPIDPTVGCSSNRSIVDGSKKVLWWSEAHGPVEFDGSQINQIGDQFLGNDFLETVEPSRLGFICAGRQPESDRVEFKFTTLGGSRNDRGIVWNCTLNRWESDNWDSIDAASLETCFDEDGKERLFLGGYSGQLFKYNNSTKNDGIVSGTTEVSWVPSAATTSAIQGTGFYNSNGKLTERKVTVLDSNNIPVARARITSNTGTSLTVTPALTNLAVGSTYTVYIGGRDCRIYSKWYDFDVPFQRKRVDRVYFHGRTDEGSVSAHISTQINFGSALSQIEEAEVGGVVWDGDDAIWDSSEWAGSTSVKRRIGVFRTAHAVRFIFLHHVPNEDFILTKIAALARVLDDRVLS